MRATIAWSLVALLGAATGGCGPNGITARRIEHALAPTFANLIQTQESLLGLTGLDVAALRASATCHRIGPGNDNRGAGDWLCTIEWFPPGRRAPWLDKYELSVTTDGCYTATADGEEGHLGGPRITLRSGPTIANLLYAFDGCFDPT
ncbi:MAG TPA: hypothetical protein VGL81_21170 [Polyangiaceae bacterium]|jgi:hypothetical protein